MSEISRRVFLRRSLTSGLIGGAILATGGKIAQAKDDNKMLGTLIDLTKCDGCLDLDLPLCVGACRTKNQHKFPKVEVEEIQNYWPQKKHEDWSNRQDVTNRLTPYNWTFVEQVDVEHEGQIYKLHIQRRCMHCDNPPCANLCPFSAKEKSPEGPVLINPDLCFGGAKCRDVCPWSIPQRQAGVGLYTKIAPKYVGGGVMYKCDLCYDLVQEGKTPACVTACPNGALSFGEKEDMRAKAHARAKEIEGYIYGEKENGGTSTFYVSPVPFEKIHQALIDKQSPFGMEPEVENFLDTVNGLATGLVVAPIAGVFAAGYAVKKIIKGED